MRMDDLIPGEVRKLRKLVLYAVQTSGCGACPPIRRCEAILFVGHSRSRLYSLLLFGHTMGKRVAHRPLPPAKSRVGLLIQVR